MIYSILCVQFMCLTQPLSMSSLVFLLVWDPLLHTTYISSPSHHLLFTTHAHTNAACSDVVPMSCHLFVTSLSQPPTWKSACHVNVHRSTWLFSSLIAELPSHVLSLQDRSHFQTTDKLCINWGNNTDHCGQSSSTHPFNGPFSGTARVGRYQKSKANLDFTEARDSEWQWHQLGHMQVCTSLQTDNHASTPPLSFFTGRMPFLLTKHTVWKHWRLWPELEVEEKSAGMVLPYFPPTFPSPTRSLLTHPSLTCFLPFLPLEVGPP